MNEMRNDKLEDYYDAAESWADDRVEAKDRSRRIAWIVAGIALALAIIEAIALVLLIPLKREVPYTLLVDRQTGYVEALQPLEQQSLTADAALTRSFLVQYVIARESFAFDLVQDRYRKVGLWSAGDARNSYQQQMQASNPLSPLNVYPRASELTVRVRSISSLEANRALVRFETIQRQQGSASQTIENWAAVIDYRFNNGEMSAEDRLDNPVGFQVTRYRRDAEALPIVEEARTVDAAPVSEAQP